MRKTNRFLSAVMIAVAGSFLFIGNLWAGTGPDGPLSSSQRSITAGVVQSSPDAQMLARFKLAERFQKALENKLAAAKAAQKFYRAVDEQVPAQEKINLFMGQIKSLKRSGHTFSEIRSVLEQRSGGKALAKGAATGSISGTVKVAGAVPPSEVQVLVFDSHGYYAGSASADMFSGAYSVDGLEEGKYYVVTSSDFVDEFYDNVVLNDYKNWRQATLVQVTAGQNTTGIDFDLAKGATIKGIVTMKETGTPLAYNMVNIRLYDPADSTSAVFERMTFTDQNGAYEVYVDMTGTFVVEASHPYMSGEFYNGSPYFAGATPITIQSPTDVIQNINFALSAQNVQPPGPGPAARGGVITGLVADETTGTPINFALVVAFNAADTSVAMVGVSGLSSLFGKTYAVEMPNYFIPALDTGYYFVMAVDLIGGHSREFYSESPTPDGATTVHVAGQDTVKNIDFTLGMGASISGTVTGPLNKPVTKAFVVAFKKFDLNNIDKFFTSLDFGIDSTDANGNYQITGLYGGDYIVRTVTKNPAVLDEWYENVYDLFDFKQATPISVPPQGQVSGINFQLEAASAIMGTTKNTAGDPISDVLVILPFDANSGKLRFGIFSYTDKSAGKYVIAKIPTGDYKLYALVSPDSDQVYHSQYYNGARTFDQASTVNVANAGPVTGIDFTFAKSGVVQGFVYLAANTAVGADTLSDFPVVLYEANTGVFAGATKVTFPGGFRILGVAPGQYKLAALPVMPPFATTYYGGGVNFSDANSTVITVAENQTVDADITLGQATGAIQGSVTDAASGDPLNMILVVAYDQTGHAVNVGMTGYDLLHEVPLNNPGQYTIPGLPTGTYYVRTFSFFKLLSMMEQLGNEGMNANAAVGGALVGGALGNSPIPQLPELTFYNDEWYDDVPVGLPRIDRDVILQLIENLRYQEFAVMPLFNPAAPGAAAVSVTDGSVTSGVNFALNAMTPEQNPFTGVEGQEQTAPARFQLLQSYPNPVRRTELSSGVTISYQLPVQTAVTVAIYNLLGQKIATLATGIQRPGVHRITWNGRDAAGMVVPNGIYFYALKAGNGFKSMKKLVVLR